MIACARRLEELKLIAANYNNIIPLHLDITNDQSINEFKDFIKEEEIYALINCAGGNNVKPRAKSFEFEKKELIESYNVNTIGNFAVIQSVIPLMKKDLNPIILTITSISGHKLVGNSMPYNLSKQSMSTIMKLLRRDLSNLGIRSTELIIGSVNSHDVSILKNNSMAPKDISGIINFVLNTDHYVNIDYLYASHIKEANV